MSVRDKIWKQMIKEIDELIKTKKRKFFKILKKNDRSFQNK